MKRLRNETGMTLAEVLATFVIASIVMTLVIGVLVFVQKQYRGQSEDAKHLTDVTIAAKAITRDIRMAEDKEINVVDEHTLEFTDRDIKYVWDSDSKILKKDDTEYIYEVESFKVSPNGMKDTGDSIYLFIKSTTEQQIETEIIIR